MLAQIMQNDSLRDMMAHTAIEKSKVYSFPKKQKEIIYLGRIDYNQKRVYRVIDTWVRLENKGT